MSNDSGMSSAQQPSGYPPIRQPDLPGDARVRVGGMILHRLSRSGWVEQFARDVACNRGRDLLPRLLGSANGHVLWRYATDVQFRDTIDGFDAIDFDGMPLVMASRLLTSTPAPQQVNTDSLLPEIVAKCANNGWRMFFLGATEEINQTACQALRSRHPQLQIDGRNGFFAPSQLPTIAAEINAFGADIVLVGMGVPLEQHIAAQLKPLLRGVTWLKTTGAGIDYMAGKTPIPNWMMQSGLGWLYRFIREPRVRRRYLVSNPHALWLLLTKTGGKIA